jgi:protein-S-isoprenylcysteine O-methyltransferase Ste14
VTRIWIALVAETAVFAALLFWPAGTVDWAQGWTMLALFLASSVVVCRDLARTSPELLNERMRSPIQAGQPLWDRVLLLCLLALFIAWYPLMAFDAVRLHWSHVPAWLNVVGAIGFVAGMAVVGRAMHENAFSVGVVRLQTERSQRVISTGPYALVRHPMYAGGLVFFFSTALLLGSWAGVAFAVLLTLIIAIRAIGEERMLTRELDGYAAYAKRVRYRLLPGIW